MKKKNKFTPGPWYLHHVTKTRRKEYEHGTTSTLLVCGNSGSQFGIATIGGPSNATEQALLEQQANARLIAAAPDLLAACEQALRLPCFQTDFMTDDELHVADLLLTVIRKARA